MFGKVDNYCSTEYSPDYTIYAKKVHQERGKERYADVPMVQVDNAWCYTSKLNVPSQITSAWVLVSRQHSNMIASLSGTFQAS